MPLAGAAIQTRKVIRLLGYRGSHITGHRGLTHTLQKMAQREIIRESEVVRYSTRTLEVSEAVCFHGSRGRSGHGPVYLIAHDPMTMTIFVAARGQVYEDGKHLPVRC